MTIYKSTKIFTASETAMRHGNDIIENLSEYIASKDTRLAKDEALNPELARLFKAHACFFASIGIYIFNGIQRQVKKPVLFLVISH